MAVATHAIVLETNTVETKKVRKWGNGLGVLLPKAIIEEFSLDNGDNITFKVEHNKFVIEPSERVLKIPSYNLDDLLASWNGEAEPFAWGGSLETPVGNEIW